MISGARCCPRIASCGDVALLILSFLVILFLEQLWAHLACTPNEAAGGGVVGVAAAANLLGPALVPPPAPQSRTTTLPRPLPQVLPSALGIGATQPLQRQHQQLPAIAATCLTDQTLDNLAPRYSGDVLLGQTAPTAIPASTPTPRALVAINRLVPSATPVASCIRARLLYVRVPIFGNTNVPPSLVCILVTPF